MLASPLPDLRASFFLPARVSPDLAVAVHGVVLDVPMGGGLDTLAAYADGTARYINHSGRTIVWEVPGSVNPLRPLIDRLLASAASVPPPAAGLRWDPPAPSQASGLATVLTRGGLVTVPLGSDATSAGLLGSGAALMKALINAIPSG